MKDHKKVFRFLLTVIGLSLCWFVLHDFWLSGIDNWLTLMVVDKTVLFLNLIGYDAEAVDIMVRINNQDAVFVYHACNGMVLMALFAGFIIAFPGPAMKKLWYIPLGIFVINSLNIIRVAALALNAHYNHETLDFNHKYTFTFFVYGVVFCLWIVWVKKFSELKKNGYTASSVPQAM